MKRKGKKKNEKKNEKMKEAATDLGQVEGGTFTTIVVITVHVEDLLALDGEDSRQNALGQSSSQHNNVILLILFKEKKRRHNSVFSATGNCQPT